MTRLQQWTHPDWAGSPDMPPEEEEALALLREQEGNHKPTRETLRVLTRDDLDTLPPPSWVVDGVVPKKSLTVLYSPPGVGKSFLSLDWALSITTGVPWQEHDTQTGRVLYVAAEGASGLLLRVSAWETRHDAERTSGCVYVPQAVNLFDASGTTQLIHAGQAMPEPPSVVVIDTLSRCCAGADENSSRDMGIIIQNCDRIKDELGCTVLLLHHSDKQGRHERGSSALRGACDALICLEDLGSGIFEMQCEKQKDAEPFESVMLQLCPAYDSCVIELPNTRGSRGGLLPPNLAPLLKDIWQLFGSDWVSTTKLEKGVTATSRTFYRLLKVAQQQKLMDRQEKGNGIQYRLTQWGEQLASAT